MKKSILLLVVSMFLFVGCKNEVKKVEKVETIRPTSPINIPVVPKENKKMTSISEVEENIIEEQKKYSHSEILRMMGM